MVNNMTYVSNNEYLCENMYESALRMLLVVLYYKEVINLRGNKND